jgi:2-polyprenyl-6-methoxyphenol hydroxylase-like FAD-dependent oxidoreductase
MRVLICGGGIAGLTLASCLARRGITPLLVERAGRLRDQGYMIDFFGSGFAVAARLGLLYDLEQIHYPVSSLTVLDPHGSVRLSIPYPVLRRRLFHDRHFNFMRGDLERLLYERIARRVEVRFGVTVTAVQERASGVVVVRLSDGSEHECDLVVGADGVHSDIRRLVFGAEERFTRFLGCYAAAYVVPSHAPGVATGDAFATLSVPRRQVAVYPLRGGGMATFFLHRVSERSLDQSRRCAVRELHAVYGDLGWVVPALLASAATAPDLFFDPVSQIELTHWSAGRVVLLGDACYCVSLLAGQGAGMAVTGAYVLAEELAGASDIPAALARYEARLRPGIERLQAAGRRVADWFLPDTPARLALRNLALRISTWPIASTLVRRRMGAVSVLAD